MKKNLIIAALVLPLLLAARLPAQSSFVWGVVKWASGYPASGLVIKLVKSEREVATTYSNPAGKFGFFGQSGAPAEYNLRLFQGPRLLKELPVGQVPVGGQLPDIIVN